ncbi:hypothetical protein ACFLYK_00600 [Candidatus Cloacimonadota bacterium]
MNRSKDLPWYTITLLNTILGALSIIIYFGVYMYGDKGWAFWAIIICWAVILITTNIEICRLDFNQKKIIKESEQEIAQLKEEIERLKK